MAYAFTKKVIISGKYAELYQYRKNVWKGYNRKINSDKEPIQLDIFEQKRLKKERAQSSISRTRTELRRLINSNPQLNKFLTLTFADNITDIKIGNQIFNLFIKRITYRYSKFEYAAVIEFQKRGAIHYHLLCSLPYIDNKILEKLWRQGYIKIRRIENIDNLGAYLSKYFGKEIDERTFGKKKFFRSQNLKQPIEITGYRAEQFIEKYLNFSVLTFEKTFYSDWTGEVKYSSFILNNQIDNIKPTMIE